MLSERNCSEKIREAMFLGATRQRDFDFTRIRRSLVLQNPSAAARGREGYAHLAFPQCPTIPAHYDGGAGPSPRWIVGRINMTNWQADLDALVQETMALTKSVRVEPTMTRAVVEPNRMPANLHRSERDEIRQRVANFKAHQERFAREREDFAASLLKSMRGQS